MSEETSIMLSERFDDEFQASLAAYICKDTTFLMQTADLISPAQFGDAALGVIVNTVLRHFRIYNQAPGQKVLISLVKKAMLDGRIREDLHPEIKDALKGILTEKLTDASYMVSEISTFARNNAFDEALVKAHGLKESGKFDEAMAVMQQAMLVGASETANYYDYFGEIESRFTKREEIASGVAAPQGITTGIKALDAILYHKGWGRREFVLIMGGAKAGKSTALGEFSLNAAKGGFNSLYVTLEVHSGIISDRLDARLSDTSMDDLTKERAEIKAKLEALAAAGTAGKYYILEKPAGTLSPNGLRRIIEDFRAKGIRFDCIALDYLDLATSNFRTNDHRHDEKQMYTDFRGLADEYDFALLSATQTNRDGMGSETATATHVADNIEKIRIADLVISINKTDAEKAAGEARLFLAASRNQRGDISVKVKQNLDKMKFVERVIDVS